MLLAVCDFHPPHPGRADYKLSGVLGFGNADVKKECSLDHSGYTDNEGKSSLHLSLVLF